MLREQGSCPGSAWLHRDCCCHPGQAPSLAPRGSTSAGNVAPGLLLLPRLSSSHGSRQDETEVRRKMNSGAGWQQGPLICSGVGSPLPSSTLLFVSFTLQGWVSCSNPSHPTGMVSCCLLGVPTEVCVTAQSAETEQGCGSRDGLCWGQTQNQQWNLQTSPSLLVPFLPRASLLSRLRIQMVSGVLSLLLCFLHGYFYPFVFLSLGLWVHVAATGACGCRQEGGLGGDFGHKKANDARPEHSS